MGLEVVINKKTISLDLADSATFSDLMQKLQLEQGIDIAKQVLLHDCKEFRMPSYEDGKLVVYDGQESVVVEDKPLLDFEINESEPLVCGELQSEWLESVGWGVFGHTVFEADYLNHREYIVFNGRQAETTD